MKTVDDVCRTYMNVCKKCDTSKSLTEFYDLTKEAKCKTCVSKARKEQYQKQKAATIARVTKYRTENPEKIRDAKLKQAYGVGVDYYNAKLLEQGGVCAGCKRNLKVKWRGKEVAMPLDHNHETKQPRGVLCIKCNRALGLLEENENTLDNLKTYIKQYKKVG